MIYGGVPVIIPILATGYLLTVYLLLVLAQKQIRSSDEEEIPISRGRHQQETAVAGKVKEVSG